MLKRSLLCIGMMLSLWFSGKGQSINRIEYFIDNDPGFGNGTAAAFTPGSVVTKTFPATLPTALPDGLHWLSVRARDAAGKWSTVVVRPFYKEMIPVGNTLANLIRIEYFVDIDPGYGNGVAVPFTAATSVNQLQFSANLASVSPGTHLLMIRARDSLGKWSTVGIREFTVTEVPPAATCASTATGAWTDASKWSCGHVPTTADDVVIRLGHVITLNVEGKLKNLQIQDNSRLEYGTGGSLKMGSQ